MDGTAETGGRGSDGQRPIATRPQTLAPPADFDIARRLPSARRARAGTADRRGAAARIFPAASPLAAAGLRRPCFLQQRRRAAAVRGNLEGIGFVDSPKPESKVEAEARSNFGLWTSDFGLTSARSLAASSATRRNWSSSPMRKFSGATKSSGRAARNPRTRWRRVPRSTLISRIWRKAIWSCICSTASGAILG